MNRIMISILAVLLMGGFYGLYSLSLQVRDVQRETTRLERQSREEHEAIRVLKAEWAYLNRPEYIQKMVDQLGLVQMAPGQLGTLADLPYLQPVSARDGSGPILPQPNPRGPSAGMTLSIVTPDLDVGGQ